MSDERISTHFWCIGCQAEHKGEPAATIGDCHHCRDCQAQWEETMRDVEEHDARIADVPHVRMLCR